MTRSAFRAACAARSVFAFAVAFPLVASNLSGQSAPVVSGVVTDSVGNALSGAIVTVAGGDLKARTDDRGEFRITGVSPGRLEIRARRLGFLPRTQEIEVSRQGSPAPLHITLTLQPSALKPVVVEASKVHYRGRLAGYYERLERRSSGVFIDRTEIDKKDYRTLTQLLSQSPGVSSLRIRGGGGGAVRMRGRACRPLVWLDGVPMPAGEVDLDAFPVSTIHGIELYLGSTTAPINYTAVQGQSNCGTILLWSRGPDTEPTNRANHTTTDLEQLTQALSIYTADQVDTVARLRTVDSLEVTYPPSLFAAGIEGSVLAEFVVGSDGNIEASTFNIVSSTHPLFVDAVSRALENADYSPAIKGGRRVRQLVHQRFAFVRRSNTPQSSRND
jgi:TonB family protein